MYLIVTRSFPPELGGMQSLMWGLARELSKSFMIKVLAPIIQFLPILALFRITAPIPIKLLSPIVHP